MAHGLQEPAHAPGAARRTKKDGNAEALAGFAGEVLEDFLARRSLVHQELLEELVVMIGEPFEHLRPRLDARGPEDRKGCRSARTAGRRDI